MTLVKSVRQLTTRRQLTETNLNSRKERLPLKTSKRLLLLLRSRHPEQHSSDEDSDDEELESPISPFRKKNEKRGLTNNMVNTSPKSGIKGRKRRKGMKVNQAEEKIDWDVEKANKLIFVESEEELEDLREEELMDQAEDKKKRKKIMKLKMRLKKLQGTDKEGSKPEEKDEKKKKKKKAVGDYRKEFYLEKVFADNLFIICIINYLIFIFLF